MNIQKIAPLYAAIAFTTLSLGSCSNVSSPDVAHSFIVTVQATHNDNPQQLASWYKGKVLSFVPEAGFAILKVDQLPSSTDPKVRHIEKNISLETSEKNLRLEQPNPVLTAGAKTGIASVGMSGWSTWSNGWSTWSNGWSTWSNGMTLPNPPAQNNPMFQNTRLASAHAIARKYGDGVTVAVLDTGLDMSHPGVINNLVEPARRWDFVSNDNNPSEVSGAGYGHGTAVTGLILQVAPDAKIMPLRVLDQNGLGDLDNVIAAIDFAVKNGAKVINISLGADDYADALRTMIQYAKNNQVYITAAAGNQARVDSASFPARMGYWGEGRDFLFSVGSVNVNDEVSTFSNRGNDVNFFAPGENLTTFAPNNRTMVVTGTSFAAPLVAGAIALAYSAVSDSNLRGNLGLYLTQSLEKQSLWWTLYATQSKPWQHSLGRLDVERFLLSLPNSTNSNTSSGATEMVYNGNFEIGAEVSSDGWTTPGSRIEFDPSTGKIYSGKGAAVINNQGSAYQDLRQLKTNTVYQVTAWVRVFRQGETASLAVSGHGNNLVSQVVTFSPDNRFQKISFEFSTGAVINSPRIVFEKFNGTEAAALDLVSIVRR